MNEGEEKQTRNQTVFEAIVAVFFIFLALIYFIYKFGNSNQSVTNTDINTGVEQDLSSLDDEGGENEIYFKYIKKIFEEQSANGGANVDVLVSEYEQELKDRVTLPTQNITLVNVSSDYNRATYNTSFENAFIALKQGGGTSESGIFSSQIVDATTLLQLSDYDKETLLRIATEYEKFGNTILSLPTPSAYEKRGLDTARDALNIAYILRQMVNINDKQIYTLWISKYSENIFDIIANRYVE